MPPICKRRATVSKVVLIAALPSLLLGLGLLTWHVHQVHACMSHQALAHGFEVSLADLVAVVFSWQSLTQPNMLSALLSILTGTVGIIAGFKERSRWAWRYVILVAIAFALQMYALHLVLVDFRHCRSDAVVSGVELQLNVARTEDGTHALIATERTFTAVDRHHELRCLNSARDRVVIITLVLGQYALALVASLKLIAINKAASEGMEGRPLLKTVEVFDVTA